MRIWRQNLMLLRTIKMTLGVSNSHFFWESILNNAGPENSNCALVEEKFGQKTNIVLFYLAWVKLQRAYKKLQSAILLEYHLRTRVYPLETCISFEPLLAQTSCRLFHRSSPNGIGGAAIIFPAISFFSGSRSAFHFNCAAMVLPSAPKTNRDSQIRARIGRMNYILWFSGIAEQTLGEQRAEISLRKVQERENLLGRARGELSPSAAVTNSWCGVQR